MYSQLITKQFVWGPYNRSGPYNGCLSESITGNCLSGSSHWHSFPVGNCLCRHWVILSSLGYWPPVPESNMHLQVPGEQTYEKTQSWAQKSTEMMELIRSWSQIMSIPVDLNFRLGPRLPVTSAITAGCVWCTTKAHAHDRVWKKHKWVGMSSTCQDVDLLILIYLNEKSLGNTSHLVSNHFCDLCDLKWQQRWLGEWDASYTLQFSYWRLKSWEGRHPCRIFERCNNTLWSMGGSEGFQASIKDKDNHTPCFAGGCVSGSSHLSGAHILALFYRLSKYCLSSWMTESWGYTAVSGEVRICWFNKHSLGIYYVAGAVECALQIVPGFVLKTAPWVRYYCYPWFTDEKTEAQRGQKLTQDHSAGKWKSQD